MLNAEATPKLDTATWTFRIEGLVAHPITWTWDEIRALPRSRFAGAIHCVTTWSKFDMTFDGVSVDTLLATAAPLPQASHVLAFSHTGYTTNLPLEDVRDDKAWVVWELDGQPLAVEHGGPARLLVPHLYFWKSAKWVAGLRLLDHDEPGFWEQNGYHDRGDPLARAALPRGLTISPSPVGPTSWETATVVAIRPETARAKTFRLALSDPVRYLAGQHYVVRLTAPDGYAASRSYSVASAPDGSREVELTVERLEDGEVSGFLHDVVEVGDELEVRGPIGGFFVRDAITPVVLVGGGSGVVPAHGHAPPGPERPAFRSHPIGGVSPDARGPVLRGRASRPRIGGRLHPSCATRHDKAPGTSDAGRRGVSHRGRTRDHGVHGIRLRLQRVR